MAKREASKVIRDSKRFLAKGSAEWTHTPSMISSVNSTDDLSETLLCQPSQPTPTTDAQGIKMILGDWPSLLLIFFPVGLLVQWMGTRPGIVFATNLIALIPLAKILGDTTEELAVGVKSEAVGGLLSATFGNAVELILTVQSLRSGLVTLVKGSLLGSILSNLLLVLGMAFFAGGLGKRGKEQMFRLTGPMVNITMLLVAVMTCFMTTVFRYSVGAYASEQEVSNLILVISRISAIFIIISYVSFLFFQLYSHISIFETPGENNEQPLISVKCSLFVLSITTACVALSAEYLVESVDGLISEWGLSASFIGVILLPIVGNACEHLSAIKMCMIDKPVLAIGIAVGSSTQIALFTLPVAVLLSWWIDPSLMMDFDFSIMNAVALLMSVLIALSIVVDGNTNWFEGLMLMVTYAILCVVYWFDPTPARI